MFFFHLLHNFIPLFFIFLHPKILQKREDCSPETVFFFVSVVATTLLQTFSFFNSFFNIFLLYHPVLICNVFEEVEVCTFFVENADLHR